MIAFGNSMNLIQNFNGLIKLGLYSIDNDFWNWHSVVNSLYHSPIYLLFNEGQFIELKQGLLNNDDFQRWVEDFIASS